ncbi:hypothetical protein [Occultella gossypii]|uniref:Uncharacterized protein n=1 Tax=Occultella gossypii TaxID=2800820 RepID=A0ABS7SAB3_9MICO|nr:hypothetical protein [Occultella gossypii]MBZ2197284.1 hypothetical protein [Occultella gossypii]
MSDVVIGQIIQAIGLVVVAFVGGRKLNRIGKDARTSATQTENEHSDGDYPNLRDELTSVRTSVEKAVHEIGGVRSEVGDLRGEVGDLRGELRGVRKDVVGLHQEDAQIRDELALAVTERERRLTSLSRSIPGVVAELIADKFQEWTRPKEEGE